MRRFPAIPAADRGRHARERRRCATLRAALFEGEDEAHDAHAGARDPFDPGMTSLIAEFTGRMVLSGDERDRSTAEVLFGVSHVLTEKVEVNCPLPAIATLSTGIPSG
jgi:hypothetical protein